MSEQEHILPTRLYVIIWLALIVLTVVTAAVSFIDLGPFNTVVALSIATFKATLVILFFMHVKYTHEKLTPVVIVSAIFFLGLLLSLSMSDYLTR
jgi:cytochrome c oxidase subunit 4